MSGNIELFHVIWFPFAAAFLCYLAGKRHKIVRDRLLVMSVVLEMGLMLWAVSAYVRQGELQFLLEGFCMKGLYL